MIIAEISEVLQAMTTEKYQVTSLGWSRATIMETMRRTDVLFRLAKAGVRIILGNFESCTHTIALGAKKLVEVNAEYRGTVTHKTPKQKTKSRVAFLAKLTCSFKTMFTGNTKIRESQIMVMIEVERKTCVEVRHFPVILESHNAWSGMH